MHLRTFALALILLATRGVTAQPLVEVDDGVLRWKASGDEVALFGINYSTPFAFSYRAHERRGVPHEAAIDADVAHMARLGFDAYRIHVWDREVSDAAGNLLENEHLRLLDYLISKLKERNIYILLTPIAWWGNGWPEPDTPTSGFSNNYSRAELSSDPEALRIQQNYIRQFLNHTNPYTGLSYKDDPSIIAFELFNEPEHPEPPAQTTKYVNDLVEAARSTGLDKPIFYNVSQNWSTEHARAIAAADVDGVSFQWYPAGLVRRRGIDGNMLPHVDHYPIPAQGIDGFDRLARMVYEFDAADVLGSYMYPAMARSFREAGMQWATQFSYDPLAIAGYNTEYSTHFVNLAYAPAKALSLMIAAEAFRRLPRGKSYGDYPDNTRFGPVRVSYEEDLSELATSTFFYHSNTTATEPPALDSLRHIAGFGSSPLVRYDGTGAYFLDKLSGGIWRLEVYPDAVWIRDPYGTTTSRRPVSILVSRRHDMDIRLPDLGEEFIVRGLDEGNTTILHADASRIAVEPGVYLLHHPDARKDTWTPETAFRGGRLGEFFVPETVPDGSETVLSTPPSEVTNGEPLYVNARVAAETPPDDVYAYVRHQGAGRFERFELHPSGPYDYVGEAESRQIRRGLVEYYIVVKRDGTSWTYPGGVEGDPYDWNFPGNEGWTVPVVDTTAPLVLFEARRDRTRMYYPHQSHYLCFRSDLVSGTVPIAAAIQARVRSLEPEPHHFALQASVLEHIRAGLDRLGSFDAVEARIRAVEPSTGAVTLAVIASDGSSWGATIHVGEGWSDVRVPLSDLRPIERVLLPRPYPFFLPYWFEGSPSAETIPLTDIEAVEFSIDGRDGPNERAAPHGYEIERVLLIRSDP